MDSILKKVYKADGWLDLTELAKFRKTTFDRFFRFPFLFLQFIDNSQTTMKIYDDRIDVYDHNRKYVTRIASFQFNIKTKQIKIPGTRDRQQLAIMDPLIWSIIYKLNLIQFMPRKYLPLSKWFKINNKQARVVSREDGMHFQFYESSSGRKFEFTRSEFGILMYKLYRMKLWTTYKKRGRKKGSGKQHSRSYGS